MSLLDADYEVRPLLARVAPIVGESLLSLITRACRANVIERQHELLGPLGISRRTAFAPFTAHDRSAPLAKLLTVREEEIAKRMHAPVVGAPDPSFVHWFGTTLERRLLKAEPRRFAPFALGGSSHHRAIWSVSALSFCPETFQELISSCGACARELGWTRTEGLDRCEHCRASLLDMHASYVPPELRSALTAVTDLISTDPAVRAVAAARFPPPFCSWPPGEIFGAVVELGVAWAEPGAGRESEIGKALIWGAPGFASCSAICAGYEVARGWPDSLTGVLSRTCDALAGRADQLALTHLGLLARHLDRRLPASRFRQLIRDTFADAAAAADAPVKLQRTASTATASAFGLLTMAEAKAASGISDRVLRRLRPDGESFRGGRGGRGGSWRLDAERFAQAAAAYQQGVSPAQAAVQLGVPTYTIGAFVTAKMLCSVEDADALRLAAEPLMIERESLSRLDEQLRRTRLWPYPGVLRPNERARAYLEGAPDFHSKATILAMARLARSVVLPDRHGEVLVRFLAGEFSPTAWAHALQGVLKGRVITRYLSSAEPWTSRLIVDPDSLAAWLKRRRSPAPFKSTLLTAHSAGLLLGVASASVRELIAGGHLKAVRSREEWNISLDAVQEFHGQWVLSPEVRRRRCHGTYARLDLVTPELVTRHLRGWRRATLSAELFV